VIGVQDEDALHRPHLRGARTVGLARHREHHVQEVLDETQVVARIDEGLADRILVGHGGDRRHLGDEPVGGDPALLGIVDVGAVVIKGAHGANHPADHGHGMRITAKTPIKGEDLLVQHGVMGDGALELSLCRGVRQLPVEQEVTHLQEPGLLRQLLDGIAAIEELALVAVDVGDLGLAARGGGETGVEGEIPGLLIELADVDNVRAQAALAERQHDRMFSRFFAECHGPGGLG